MEGVGMAVMNDYDSAMGICSRLWMSGLWDACLGGEGGWLSDDDGLGDLFFTLFLLH